MRQLEETLHLLVGQDPSIDPEEMIDRIERDLSEAGVPVVAWHGSSIMQTQEKRPEMRPLRSRKVWVFAAALVVALAAIGIPVWLLGGDESQDTMSGPAEVFTWEDDISEWVTVDEMETMFKRLSRRYAGVNLEDDAETVAFIRAGSGVYTDQWDWSYPARSEPAVPDWTVSVQGEPGEQPVVSARSDPRLPEGVVFWEDWGWDYIVKGPNSDEAISVHLWPPRELGPYPDRKEPYDDMYFELVSMMLREMGWAD